MDDTKNNTWVDNTGYRNTGNLNTGDRNTGDRNTGYLNSKTPKVVIFDVQTDIEYGDITFPDYFSYDTVEWIYANDMTDEEKKNNPLYWITDWYLKKLSDKENKNEYMKDCWKISFDKAKVEDVRKTLDLPHFDYSKFEVISGITKEMFDKKLGKEDTSDKAKRLN